MNAACFSIFWYNHAFAISMNEQQRYIQRDLCIESEKISIAIREAKTGCKHINKLKYT